MGVSTMNSSLHHAIPTECEDSRDCLPGLERNFRSIILDDIKWSSTHCRCQSQHQEQRTNNASFGPPSSSQDSLRKSYWGETERVRSNMINLLGRKVQQRCKTIDLTLVRELEELLWKQSNNDVKAYSNLSTLQERFRSLMAVLVIRRLGRKRQASTSKRTKILLEVMGMTQFKKAHALVQTIKELKMKYMANHTKSCCSGSACLMSALSSAPSHSLGFSMPVAVQALYFQTALVPAFEKYPLNRLAEMDWNTLLEQAEQNVLAFQQLSSSNTPPSTV